MRISPFLCIHLITNNEDLLDLTWSDWNSSTKTDPNNHTWPSWALICCRRLLIIVRLVGRSRVVMDENGTELLTDAHFVSWGRGKWNVSQNNISCESRDRLSCPGEAVFHVQHHVAANACCSVVAWGGWEHKAVVIATSLRERVWGRISQSLVVRQAWWIRIARVRAVDALQTRCETVNRLRLDQIREPTCRCLQVSAGITCAVVVDLNVDPLSFILEAPPCGTDRVGPRAGRVVQRTCLHVGPGAERRQICAGLLGQGSQAGGLGVMKEVHWSGVQTLARGGSLREGQVPCSSLGGDGEDVGAICVCRHHREVLKPWLRLPANVRNELISWIPL